MKYRIEGYPPNGKPTYYFRAIHTKESVKNHISFLKGIFPKWTFKVVPD